MNPKLYSTASTKAERENFGKAMVEKLRRGVENAGPDNDGPKWTKIQGLSPDRPDNKAPEYSCRWLTSVVCTLTNAIRKRMSRNVKGWVYIANSTMRTNIMESYDSSCMASSYSTPEFPDVSRALAACDNWQHAHDLTRLCHGSKRAKKSTNIHQNEVPIKACVARFESWTYSQQQFLKAVSHSVGAHTATLQVHDADNTVIVMRIGLIRLQRTKSLSLHRLKLRHQLTIARCAW